MTLNRTFLLSLLAAIIAVYFLGAWNYHVLHPTDLYRHLAGSEVTFSRCNAFRVFHKYRVDDDIVIFWPEGINDAHAKWDSTILYDVTFSGRNNLTIPVRFDSVWIVNSKTQEVYFRSHQESIKVNGHTIFSGYLDLRRGFYEFQAFKVWAPPTKADLPDSLAKVQFQTHSLLLRFFTSDGEWSIAPKFYYTYPIDRSKRDSVRAA